MDGCNSKVFKFNPTDGAMQYMPNFKVQGSADSKNLIPPEGPRTFEALFETLQYFMTTPEYPPVLIVQSNWSNTCLGTNFLQSFHNSNGGNAWGPVEVNFILYDENFETLPYISMGDSVAFNNNLQQTIIGRYWLFAHSKIVQSFPAKLMNTNPMAYNFYNANVEIANSSFPDLPMLYHSVGQYTSYLKPPPFSLGMLKAFVVLKTTPSYPNWVGLDVDVRVCQYNGTGCVSCNTRISDFLNLSLTNGCICTQQGSIPRTTNFILESGKRALDNVMDCILGKSSALNSTFQGLTTADGQLRNDIARRIMVALCNSEVQIDKYPNICACLGRKGVEDALRAELGNNTIRMVCYSQACIDGERTGGVFTFTPTPPCAPINICKPGVDIDAARVSMTNVTFNCDGQTTPITTPAGGDSPPLPSNESLPLDPVPNKDDNTGVIIGASIGGAVLLVIIIVIVVVVSRRKRK